MNFSQPGTRAEGICSIMANVQIIRIYKCEKIFGFHLDFLFAKESSFHKNLFVSRMIKSLQGKKKLAEHFLFAEYGTKY